MIILKVYLIPLVRKKEIWSDCMIGSNDAYKAYNLSYSYFKGKFIIEQNML
jgi:hypothetical protein